MIEIIQPNVPGKSVKPCLTFFPSDRPDTKGAVLIFPGGGYDHVSVQKEGSSIAEALNRNGFHAFVLDYRVKPFPGRDILTDAVQAVKTVKKYLMENRFENRKLALMGFSAGGHLALMETQHWAEVHTENEDISGRPDALILCYPVVTFMEPYAHQGSRANFLGEENLSDDALIGKYSAERYISPDFPPVFLWHCEGDESVPVENTLMLREALIRADISNKVILYKNGAHGLGLATDDAVISAWFAACVEWLQTVF